MDLPDVEKVSPQEANAAEAGTILEAAGYTKGADGIYEKDGTKLELTLMSVEGGATTTPLPTSSPRRPSPQASPSPLRPPPGTSSRTRARPAASS
ncbi:hypothetical protein NKG05_08735 [Oerskovia sp. M15]